MKNIEEYNIPASTRVSSDPEKIAGGFLEHLKYSLAVAPEEADVYEKYQALSLTIRDRILERWLSTKKCHRQQKAKTVCYFSFEFLMGRAMGNNVINLGLEDNVREAMEKLGLSWDEMREVELDEALGNGGLGRLAACFLDSLATLDYPAYGYGLRYEFGLFKQVIRNGYQEEEPDEWLKHGNPWEVQRPDIPAQVPFGGRLEKTGTGKVAWVDTTSLAGIPYDIPIIGYGGKMINTLRLWKAESDNEFNYNKFNEGDFIESMDEEMEAATLTKLLYPNDNFYEGQELRFRQQYFFVSCSLQDILRRFKEFQLPLSDLPEKIAIQLNDTHPAIAIPELLRLLVDQERMTWENAWDITQRTFGFTNHTLMPEALETWPLSLFEKWLPRHLDIIYRINYQFIQDISSRYPGDMDKMKRLSIIDENGGKRVRMAHLAIVGSNSVNGVAELHSRLIRERLVPDFFDMFPSRFNNKTNGITQRRWLLKANPLLSDLITETIGEKWITDLSELKKLETWADDPGFRAEFRKIKQEAKKRLSAYCEDHFSISLDPDSIFDVQVKRIHEYKRQLLNVLRIIVDYNRLKRGETMYPRTILFGGKAASGYFMAKLIIKLINAVAQVVNSDPQVSRYLRVHFLPDYKVSMAERIFPAADLSEQISTAGTEASGTGNMKFMVNGAVTIGTLDGANIEIIEEVGSENAFIFGLKAEEVSALRPGYNPREYYEKNPETRSALDLLSSGHFNRNEPGIFDPIRDMLLEHDTYMHLADLPSYLDAQKKIEMLYGNRDAWDRIAILNVARSGKFSSDRTIREYAEEIWKLRPCPVPEHNGELSG